MYCSSLARQTLFGVRIGPGFFSGSRVGCTVRSAAAVVKDPGYKASATIVAGIGDAGFTQAKQMPTAQFPESIPMHRADVFPW
jgi:hypothetical protein